jgi:hypothetical protein
MTEHLYDSQPRSQDSTFSMMMMLSLIHSLIGSHGHGHVYHDCPCFAWSVLGRGALYHKLFDAVADLKTFIHPHYSPMDKVRCNFSTA